MPEPPAAVSQPAVDPARLAALTAAEAAASSGREIHTISTRQEAAQTVLDPVSDLRPSMANFSPWEARHVQRLLLAAETCPVEELKPLFRLKADLMAETSRGRKGWLTEAVLTHSFRFKGERREKLGRVLGLQRRRDEETD